MRLYLLTPSLVLGLIGGGEWTDGESPTVEEAVERHTAALVDGIDHGWSVGGLDLSVLQIGAIRPRDHRAAFLIAHDGGPEPRRCRAWIGRQRASGESLEQAFLLDAGGSRLINVSIPPDPSLSQAHFWLAVDLPDGGQQRAACRLRLHEGEG